MKHFYLSVVALFAASLSLLAEPMQITDFNSQARGRYSCKYWSPLPGPDGKPWGDCTEQPMIVEDYFAEQDGDVNIGYLFVASGILKGHIDFAAGTIEIMPRSVSYYYEDPDDFNDPGRPVWFCVLDKKDGKYVPNYERPFRGTFELHDGMITKITTDDVWAYTVRNEDGSHYGYMEIAENSIWYLGHGEMEHIEADGQKVQTIVHATSDGKQAKVYNFMNSGWDKPVVFDVDAATKTVSSAPFEINGLAVSNAGGGNEVNATLRAVSWDVDKRDTYDYPEDLCVMDFGDLKVGDRTAANVRVYGKENFTQGSSGIANVDAEGTEAEYYDLRGMRIARPAHGIVIERRGSSASKRVVR